MIPPDPSNSQRYDPLDSAPRDGRIVILLLPGGIERRSWWEPGLGQWFDVDPELKPLGWREAPQDGG